MIKANDIEVKTWKFPGGEVGVNVYDNISTLENLNNRNWIVVQAQLSSSDDLMKLMMTIDALKRNYSGKILLDIPYLPYAQQDRVCELGESLSIKVVADMINMMKLDKVYLWDCHSDVAPALINNCYHFPVWQMFQHETEFEPLIHQIKMGEGMILVSPDAGSNKKLNKLSEVLDGRPVIKCDKVRCTKTGEITETEVYATKEEIENKSFLIVDDICVGGKTFINIAKKLKNMGAKDVSLYVTHGVFSNGIQHLIDNGIDWVYCTGTRHFSENIKHHKKLTILGMV